MSTHALLFYIHMFLYPCVIAMQWSVHPPSQFLGRCRDRLLPDWAVEIRSVVLLLQRADCKLCQRNPRTEQQKQVLRDRFLHWGSTITHYLSHQGFAADLFDPKTGYPVFSQAGPLMLDDVAVVRACLGYERVDQQGCWMVLHPEWGSAVYPSVLVSSAAPDLVTETVHLLTRDKYASEIGL
jgi:hypothetical protein